MAHWMRGAWAYLFCFSVFAALVASCSDESGQQETGGIQEGGGGGKADDLLAARRYEVFLTNPHCDVCSTKDKDVLLARSAMLKRIVSQIDGAVLSVDVSQFTFSRAEIEAALLRAHTRGVKVRLAMDSGQAQGDNPSSRLKAAGVPVRFVKGKPGGGGNNGLLHAKFMLVDGQTLLAGSNNWSSTGLSVNEENTILVQGAQDDALLAAFRCAFEAIWEQQHATAVTCSTDEVAFTPGSRAISMLKDSLGGAQSSIDVLMHHFLLDDLIKALAQAAERKVKVRVIVNAADRAEVSGPKWNRFKAAGGQLRFKQGNAALYQLMHDKLAIVDGKTLLDGSGNWSGSAFFNNFEFYVRHQRPEVVAPFNEAFERIWRWSLSAESLDNSLSAAAQDAQETKIYFGNLHAHYALKNGARVLDDGMLEREIDGALKSVEAEAGGDPARYAYTYARDVGRMDFLALSPHIMDDSTADQVTNPNMSREGYRQLLEAAKAVSAESAGAFLALASQEWNTNSQGNHVNIFGSAEPCKIERGRFDLLYGGFLPARRAAGDAALVMLNHPRTLRNNAESLNGAWDQVFDVSLLDVPKAGERKVKFNDYGLDDYPPLRDVLASWISGAARPDRAVVNQTLANVAAASAPYVRLMEVTLGRGEEIAGTEGINPDLTEPESCESAAPAACPAEGEACNEAQAECATPNLVRVTKVHSDFDYYLLRGWKLAPTASHDNHKANWGSGHSSRTAVIAGALSEGELSKAIDRRSVYASEDQNLKLRFYAAGRIRAGEAMRTVEDKLTLQVLLSDPDFQGPFAVKVYQGAVGAEKVELAAEASVAADSWTAIDVSAPGSGESFYYLEVFEQAPDRMAWSAPIWVERL